MLADRTRDGAGIGALAGDAVAHGGQQGEGFRTGGNGPLARGVGAEACAGEGLVVEGQLIDRTADVVGQQLGLVVEVER